MRPSGTLQPTEGVRSTTPQRAVPGVAPLLALWVLERIDGLLLRMPFVKKQGLAWS